jgi:hypothetical protein
MHYTLRQRLGNYVMPDTDPFMGLPYSRTWTFLTDAYIAYDNRRWGGSGEDRGTRDPLVMMARLWVIIAQWIHSTFGQGRTYSVHHPETPAAQIALCEDIRQALPDSNDVCNYCGDTIAEALVIDGVCADCHAELEA